MNSKENRQEKGQIMEKKIPICNILSGAPAMTGHHKGSTTLLKRAVPTAHTVHCIIHGQHLVEKILNERLHTWLHYVKAINKKQFIE